MPATTPDTEHRVFCEWANGSYISSLTPNFTAELCALVVRFGPPDKVEFRAHAEGWTHGADAGLDDDDGVEITVRVPGPLVRHFEEFVDSLEGAVYSA